MMIVSKIIDNMTQAIMDSTDENIEIILTRDEASALLVYFEEVNGRIKHLTEETKEAQELLKKTRRLMRPGLL